MSTDYLETLRGITMRLDGYKDRVDTRIDPGDEMFRGDLVHYLSVTYSAIVLIVHAMASVGRTDCARILDLPCGHGRVMRGLRAAFPASEIVACDINRGGVEYCMRTFDAIPVYSDPEPEKIVIGGTFDLIWVGSLLTHLDEDIARRFVERFHTWLAPSGLLLFSTHGRHAATRWPSNERMNAIRGDFETRGYGYRDHPNVRAGWGTSAVSAALAVSMVTHTPDVMLIGYSERGFDDHQDVVSVLKMDIHHPQDQLLLV